MNTAAATYIARHDPAELPLKLLRTTLDVAAGAGEAETAAVKFARAARRSGLTFDTLAAAIVGRRPADGTAARALPAAWYVVVPFGRWHGVALGYVVMADIGYVAWLAERARCLDLRDAAAAVLGHVTSGGAHG